MITLVGNATADAELKFGASGTARCTWTLAVTPRVKQGDAWTDGETGFYRCTAWRQLAESAGESITRGMRLLVQGRLSPRSYETNGEKRLSLDIEVEHVGAEMRYSTITAAKAQRAGEQRASAPSADPWSSSPDSEQPPF
jgi:single-strand DNA-binding protein